MNATIFSLISGSMVGTIEPDKGDVQQDVLDFAKFWVQENCAFPVNIKQGGKVVHTTADKFQ